MQDVEHDNLDSSGLLHDLLQDHLGGVSTVDPRTARY